MKPLLLAALPFLNGCVSSLHIYKHQRLQEPFASTTSVYVTNPELTEEYNLLKKSGIYQIAETMSRDIHALTLHPLKHHFVCGTGPFSASLITLGLIPISTPSTRDFSYTLAKEGIAQDFTHRLHLYSRVSIWEWFFLKKEATVMSQALCHAKREKTPASQSVSLESIGPEQETHVNPSALLSQ